jgi:hypothetical protein
MVRRFRLKKHKLAEEWGIAALIFMGFKELG